MTVITHAFDALAKSEKEAFGAPDHPVLVVQHPIGTVKLDDVNKRAEAAFDNSLKSWSSHLSEDSGIGLKCSDPCAVSEFNNLTWPRG